MIDSQRVEFYAQKILSNEISFENLSTYLKNDGLNEEEVKLHVRMIDQCIQANLAEVTGRERSGQIKMVGIVLIIIGLGITMSSFLGAFDTRIKIVYIFMYGPIISGLFLIFYQSGRKSKMHGGRIRRNSLQSRRIGIRK